jgi:small subunit ribosomal protein S3
MGQKVNPIGFRTGVYLNPQSRWFSNNYANDLYKDVMTRKAVISKHANAKISKVIIERFPKLVAVNVHAALPGNIIGKKGADIEKLKQKLQQINTTEVQINVIEVKKPELDARIVAHDIARQLEKRGSFRKAMKKAIANAMKYGAKGVKINCSGRLGGAEIARGEWYKEGRIPLHTLRANIDYNVAEALTTYGIIGIKVWIYRGEFSDNDQQNNF